ncbi:MAG: hypothetical protein ACOY9J_00350 [Pseudomonadota bacterium]
MALNVIVLTALLSSLLTLLLGAVVLKLWVIPEIERHFDRKVDEAVQRIEQQLRQRIAQGFDDLVGPLRILLGERAADVARSTADIVSDGVRRVFDRLGGKPGQEK